VSAERAGFDSLWVTDQVLATTPVPPAGQLGGTGVGRDGHQGPEAYSLLGALAARTRSARLGVISLGVDRRPPALVAKIVTGIDVISHGRGVLTYGVEPEDAVPGERFIEALRVGRAMLEEEVPTFAGSYYSITAAMNRPRPVQAGGVPVVALMVQRSALPMMAVAEFVGLADAVIVAGGIDDVRRAVEEAGSARPIANGDGESEVAPLQVIGVSPMPDESVSFTGGDGPRSARVASAVRDLFDAGADGCIVPVDLGIGAEELAMIGAELIDSAVPRPESDRTPGHGS
jgi:alkanesulfonate monooxygenase SsuD/methylene tetrahydromethanopterin reductase-like flavin-dependent oxidoreductase (luciferase family)